MVAAEPQYATRSCDSSVGHALYSADPWVGAAGRQRNHAPSANCLSQSPAQEAKLDSWWDPVGYHDKSGARFRDQFSSNECGGEGHQRFDRDANKVKNIQHCRLWHVGGGRVAVIESRTDHDLDSDVRVDFLLW